MKIEMEKVIRGVECIVHADCFTEDRSVGISLGPEEVWATVEDTGVEISLTDEEIEAFAIEATERYLDADDGYLFFF